MKTMTCHDYDALLARDLEGELSPEERRTAEAHLLDCRRCTALRAERLELRWHLPRQPVS